MNNEKTYKLMSVIGAGNLALGIVVLVAGIVSGILMIVGGARPVSYTHLGMYGSINIIKNVRKLIYHL